MEKFLTKIKRNEEIEPSEMVSVAFRKFLIEILNGNRSNNLIGSVEEVSARNGTLNNDLSFIRGFEEMTDREKKVFFLNIIRLGNLAYASGNSRDVGDNSWEKEFKRNLLSTYDQQFSDEKLRHDLYSGYHSEKQMKKEVVADLQTLKIILGADIKNWEIQIERDGKYILRKLSSNQTEVTNNEIISFDIADLMRIKELNLGNTKIEKVILSKSQIENQRRMEFEIINPDNLQFKIEEKIVSEKAD